MSPPELRLRGLAASAGFAEGPLFVLHGPARSARDRGLPQDEAAALQAALIAALAALRELVVASSSEAAEVLEFQIALIEDPELSTPAFDAIAAGMAADEAWRAALEDEIAGFAAAEDAYFRARASDIRDIRDQVLDQLAGAAASVLVPAAAVLVAEDLPPSRFLAIDWSQGGALVLSAGSPTSHVAMLARSRAVPMLVGLPVRPAELLGRTHEAALVDAQRGELILAPSSDSRAAFAQARSGFAAEGVAAEAQRLRAARTADGTPVAVLLNVADPQELDTLDPALCDGIGLVRTEFLFERAGGLPDEETQYRVYRRIVEWAAGRPVTIRTLDAGGDKPIAGLTPEGETNPFLGIRGLRLSFAQPEPFRVQLRALLRATCHGPLKIMLPMVTLPAELERARAMLEAEMAALEAAGIACARPPLGIMIEVPAAALLAEQFAADFFSIGSNDLTQYVAAAARDNAGVAELAETAFPAVLRLIEMLARTASARGIELSLCGEAGGNPQRIPALLAAGLRRLSMSPAAVARAKLAISQTRLS
ncbi:phosphoenolpyruvate--protein phosphotransferase [Niveibacterium sp. SC-1]|uniref:phosphoenolpyruvate--protein phosphotransferase n=1 Tax=Niveibacterium sp. SC-1 TaxID=3135646 RepID=UPI00311F2099